MPKCVVYFRKSSQLIERAYGQSSLEMSGNRALIQLSSLLSYRHKLRASNFQKSNCCARRDRVDVVKVAEAMEEGGHTLVIPVAFNYPRNLASPRKDTTVVGVEFPAGRRLKILLQFNC